MTVRWYVIIFIFEYSNRIDQPPLDRSYLFDMEGVVDGTVIIWNSHQSMWTGGMAISSTRKASVGVKRWNVLFRVGHGIDDRNRFINGIQTGSTGDSRTIDALELLVWSPEQVRSTFDHGAKPMECPRVDETIQSYYRSIPTTEHEWHITPKSKAATNPYR